MTELYKRGFAGVELSCHHCFQVMNGHWSQDCIKLQDKMRFIKNPWCLKCGSGNIKLEDYFYESPRGDDNE